MNFVKCVLQSIKRSYARKPQKFKFLPVCLTKFKHCPMRTSSMVILLFETVSSHGIQGMSLYKSTRDLPGECSGNISHGAISHKNQRYKEITQSFDFRPYLCLDSFYFLNSYSKGKVHIQKSST